MIKIKPRIDIAFKKIFGVEENKDLLISLINAVVSKEDQVDEITLLNPYNQKNFHSDKLSILDIKARGSHGQWFNIEIQITDEADYDKRALYYWARIHTNQLKEGENYTQLTKVIGIHILNFISIPDSKKYHNVFHVKEKETNLPFFKDLELHTIELKKFTDGFGEKFEGLGDKILNALDLWSAFLTRHDLLAEAKPQDPCVQKALNVLSVMNFSDEEREAYEDRLDWLRIASGSLQKAEAKGHRRGRKEGKEEGLKEGLKEGEKKGRKEEHLLLAKAMLKEGINVAQIASITGLTDEEISKISLVDGLTPSPTKIS